MKDVEAKRKKEVIARALIDPAFRKVLFEKPHEILGKSLTPEDHAAIERFRKVIPHLGEIVGSMATDILCNHGGGGCGGSVAV